MIARQDPHRDVTVARDAQLDHADLSTLGQRPSTCKALPELAVRFHETFRCGFAAAAALLLRICYVATRSVTKGVDSAPLSRSKRIPLRA